MMRDNLEKEVQKQVDLRQYSPELFVSRKQGLVHEPV